MHLYWLNTPRLRITVWVEARHGSERVSHFRPFKDFSRISVLNTVLVTIALLWIKPRDLTLSLFSKEGWRKLWQKLFQHPEESNLRKASSVGFGVFMGIVPV